MEARGMRNRWLAGAAIVLSTVESIGAHELQFRALLSGPSHQPPTASAGVGTALVTMDLDVINMEVQIDFNGLSGNTSGAQIHGRTALPGSGAAPTAVPLP